MVANEPRTSRSQGLHKLGPPKIVLQGAISFAICLTTPLRLVFSHTQCLNKDHTLVGPSGNFSTLGLQDDWKMQFWENVLQIE